MYINFKAGSFYQSNARPDMVFKAVTVGNTFATFAYFQRREAVSNCDKASAPTLGGLMIIENINGVDFVYLGVRKTKLFTDTARGCRYALRVPVSSDMEC